MIVMRFKIVLPLDERSALTGVRTTVTVATCRSFY